MAVPAKLPPTVRYAEAEYWESRYQREPAVFEWFLGHTALRRIIRAYISKKKPVLHLGCGTSNLQEGMARSGYTVVNTDISKIVITQIKERHAKFANLTYVVSDCRDMPEFLDCQFGHVVDKGTIDALLCCKQGTENVMRMLLEAYRVLQPGGSFLLVTLGDPTRRLPLLLDPRLQWKVSLLLLPKISAACQAYVDGKPINDTVKPIDAEGPYEVLDPETIVGLPAGVQYSNFFFAYVCKKQPLQLPQAQGQKAQVPNGWVAGSKELFQKLQKELGLPEDLLGKGRRTRVMVVPAGSSTAAGMHSKQMPGGSSSGAGGGSGSSAALGTTKQQPAAGAVVNGLREMQGDLAQQQQQQLRQQQQDLSVHPDTPDHDDEPGALSPCYQEQQQQQQQPLQVAGLSRSCGTGTSSMPGSPLTQLHLQRQQQQAAVAKLEAILASNVAAQLQLQQQRTQAQAQQQQQLQQLQQQQRTQAQAQQQQQQQRTQTQQQQQQQQAAASAEQRSQQMPAVDLQDVPARPASAPNLSQLAAHAGELASGFGAATPQGPGQPGDTLQVPQVLPVSAAGAAAPAGSSKQSSSGSDAAAAAQAPAAEQPLAAAAPAAGMALTPEALQSQVRLQVVQQPAESSIAGLRLPGHRDAAAEPAAAATVAAAEPAAAARWTPLGRPSPAEAAALAAGCSAAAAAAAAAAATPMSPCGLPTLLRMGMDSGSSTSRVPRLRRFSTDPTAMAMAATLSPQLALLRQAQSQHSERAADGLILHDVAAAEAYGAGAAAAAAALAAAASWGRTRPSRGRRLSGMSMISNLSTFSSASMSVNGEEDSETQEECGSSLCTTGESQLIAEAAGEGEADSEEQQQGADSDAAEDVEAAAGRAVADAGAAADESVEDSAAAVGRLAVDVASSRSVAGGCIENQQQQQQQRGIDAAAVQLAPQGDG